MKLHKVKKRTAACDELSRVEPKNIECRMSKDGIALGLRSQFCEVCSLTLFFKTDRIHYSMFDVQCSMFDVHFLVNSSFETSQ